MDNIHLWFKVIIFRSKCRINFLSAITIVLLRIIIFVIIIIEIITVFCIIFPKWIFILRFSIAKRLQSFRVQVLFDSETKHTISLKEMLSRKCVSPKEFPRINFSLSILKIHIMCFDELANNGHAFSVLIDFTTLSNNVAIFAWNILVKFVFPESVCTFISFTILSWSVTSLANRRFNPRPRWG